MKRLLILILIAISLDGMAQYRLNITKSDLIKEFDNLELLQQYSDTLIYTRSSILGAIIYYLKDDMTFMTVLIPDDNKMLRKIIGDYDVKYIRVSSNTWEQYLPEGTVVCSLHQTDELRWYFKFKIKSN
jgi:hypothetical protein